MKVFLSWSGEKSQAVAEQLRHWIPCVIQTLEPWMSKHDIRAGMRWANELGGRLSETKFGIVCLTKSNTSAPWILFEAGALAKTVDETYVCPYLVDLNQADIPPGPLSQFQAKQMDKEGTRDLIDTLNKALGDKSLPDTQLQKSFDVWWPELEEGLNNLPLDSAPPTQSRSEKEMIAEVLGIVRDISRDFGFLAELQRWLPPESSAPNYAWLSLLEAVAPESRRGAAYRTFLEEAQKQKLDLSMMRKGLEKTPTEPTAKPGTTNEE